MMLEPNSLTQEFAIECRSLRRTFQDRHGTPSKEVVALEDMTLLVRRGQVFGLLGPNGAGKTTTVRILSTLLLPTAGYARVLGYDVVSQATAVRQQIGLILGGERGLYERLTARENLVYFGALCRLSSTFIRKRTNELLEMVGLSEAADRTVGTFSRGMKQRLHIARGLLPDPEVLFMDEPTIGLDPAVAYEIRALVPWLAQEGKTILLTTHYMAEADQLCDEIAIIDRGRIIANGTPLEVKRRFSRISSIEMALQKPLTNATAVLSSIDGVQNVNISSDGTYQRITLLVRKGIDISQTVRSIVGEGSIEWLIEREPTLEDAYLNILRNPNPP